MTDNTKTLYNALDKIKELEKENADLKIKVKALENANKFFVKEIDDMSNSVLDVLLKFTKYKEENKKLKRQIYKMRNCDNCTHCGSGYKDEAGNSYCDDCDEDMSEWEMSLGL